MFSIFTSIVIWALLGSLIGWWLGPFIGLALFCGGLLMLVVISTLQLSRVERWTRNLNDPPPPAVGSNHSRQVIPSAGPHFYNQFATRGGTLASR